MAVYRFRVFIEDDHEIFRDIDLLGKHQLADLHAQVVKHFNFQQGQPAQYFNSDQSWYEGDSVVKLDAQMSGDSKRIVDRISVPRQRFLCVTVSFKDVGLAIELQKVLPEEDGVVYPRCSKSLGEPPYYTQPPPELIMSHAKDGDSADDDDDLSDEEGPTEADIKKIEKEAKAASRSGAIKAPAIDLKNLKKRKVEEEVDDDEDELDDLDDDEDDEDNDDEKERGFESFDMDDL